MCIRDREYISNILEDGTFAFGINVREPQYATLIYSREKKLIYLEPNDTLGININGRSYPSNVLFGERGGGNNNFLAEYLKENPKELNQFKKYSSEKGFFGIQLFQRKIRICETQHQKLLLEKYK